MYVTPETFSHLVVLDLVQGSAHVYALAHLAIAVFFEGGNPAVLWKKKTVTKL